MVDLAVLDLAVGRTDLQPGEGVDEFSVSTAPAAFRPWAMDMSEA